MDALKKSSPIEIQQRCSLHQEGQNNATNTHSLNLCLAT